MIAAADLAARKKGVGFPRKREDFIVCGKIFPRVVRMCKFSRTGISDRHKRRCLKNKRDRNRNLLDTDCLSGRTEARPKRKASVTVFPPDAILPDVGGAYVENDISTF
jgi:hypothetical protein